MSIFFFFNLGPRGFVGMGMAAPLMGVRAIAPQGSIQPRPLMDFGEQPDGGVNPPEKMQVGKHCYLICEGNQLIQHSISFLDNYYDNLLSQRMNNINITYIKRGREQFS